MKLFLDMAEDTFTKLAEEGMRLKFIGKLEMLPQELQEAIVKLEKVSEQNTALTAWICISYGGRAEVVAGVNELIKKGEEVTEEMIADSLWSKGMPDPDLIIRTGGDKRLSNFLMWQSAYSELFFIDEYWPAMTEEIYDRVLGEYTERERRYGK